MSFFDFEEEKIETDGYMKIKPGDNRIRILSKSISYIEDWIDNKPVRYRDGQQPETPHDEKKPFKRIAAFIVWNCLEEKIQILQLRQASIRKKIRALVEDADWGEIYHYDLKIKRTGEELRTDYEVNPMPHKPVSQQVIDAFNAKPIYLDALFDNKDPFSSENKNYTTGVFNKLVANNTNPVEITVNIDSNGVYSIPKKKQLEEHDIMELEGLLELCQPGYKESLMQRLLDKFKFTSLDQLTQPIFEFCKREAIEKKKEYAEFKRQEAELEVGF